jgi:hypothetical protein
LLANATAARPRPRRSITDFNQRSFSERGGRLSSAVMTVHILAHHEHSFWNIVNTHSGLS